MCNSVIGDLEGAFVGEVVGDDEDLEKLRVLLSLLVGNYSVWGLDNVLERFGVVFVMKQAVRGLLHLLIA